MTVRGENAASGNRGSCTVSYIERFNRRMIELESRRAPVIVLTRRRRFLRLAEFPFASVSVLVMLLSLFSLSMYLGGWTWSSWTYAFSLGIAFPLVAIEVKRKAIITGGAAILLAFTVIIDAGLPRYFGYSPSNLSWYDLTAHFLGALLLTLLLWSFICWTLSPTGPPKENGRRKFVFAITTMLVVSVVFEFAEFMTDMFFGWGNFHPGIDTLGDLIFDIAGVMTAAVMISRHRVSALRKPFWHSEPSVA
jgi:hypothetical protein